MKSYRTLLPDYIEYYSVDLQKNKKIALLVNVMAILIGVIMAVPMHFVVPISTLYSMDQGFFNYILRFVVLLVSMVGYMILHELIHGVAMKICGTKKVKYGFTGLYAFAGSDDYYNKKAYIFIALAPVVLWGLIIAIINCFIPVEWFWVVYIVQIINISGAAGDLFVTFKFSRFPKDIIVKDYGVGMTVYSKE